MAEINLPIRVSLVKFSEFGGLGLRVTGLLLESCFIWIIWLLIAGCDWGDEVMLWLSMVRNGLEDGERKKGAEDGNNEDEINMDSVYWGGNGGSWRVENTLE